jgi:hypothetical protein
VRPFGAFDDSGKRMTVVGIAWQLWALALLLRADLTGAR